VSAAETPRTFAARLRGRWQADAGLHRDLDDVLAQLERASYGRTTGHERSYELADATERVIGALARASSFGARLRALFAPASVFTRAAARERRSELTLS
jgi:hypothetical protein